MRSVRKRWTVCTISLLLIFYKTKEITRTEERQEAALAGDGVLSLSRSMINSSDKIIQKGGSSIFQHAAEGWKINSSLVMEISGSLHLRATESSKMPLSVLCHIFPIFIRKMAHERSTWSMD